jgi:sec-independent protein translocase protein TatB
MFDIGFWELCLIAVVALLILGPERLPVAARTAGLWIGKARRLIGNVKSEIDRELQLDELRERLKDEEVKIREETGLGDLEGMAENTISDVKSYQSELNTETNLDEDAESPSDPNPKTEDTTQSSEQDPGHIEYEPTIDQPDDRKI